MLNDYVSYRKFTDTDAANEVLELLTANNIDCKLQDNTHAYVKIVGYNQIDLGITLNIKSSDFEAADKILMKYYAENLDQVDKDYYLFGFSDTELKEIVDNPYDWGQFDLQLAKKLLKEKGQEYSESYISERKQEKIATLSIIKKVSVTKLVAGYLLSILMPPFGMITGLTIIYNRNLLPNGEKFYVHTKQDRMHGRRMVFISILFIILIVLKASY